MLCAHASSRACEISCVRVYNLATKKSTTKFVTESVSDGSVCIYPYQSLSMAVAAKSIPPPINKALCNNSPLRARRIRHIRSCNLPPCAYHTTVTLSLLIATDCSVFDHATCPPANTNMPQLNLFVIELIYRYIGQGA